MQFKERLSSCRTSKLVTYKKGDGSDVSSTSGESSSDEENFIDLRTLQAQGDLPQEFWQVRVDFFFFFFKHDVYLYGQIQNTLKPGLANYGYVIMRLYSKIEQEMGTVIRIIC